MNRNPFALQKEKPKKPGERIRSAAGLDYVVQRSTYGFGVYRISGEEIARIPANDGRMTHSRADQIVGAISTDRLYGS